VRPRGHLNTDVGGLRTLVSSTFSDIPKLLQDPAACDARRLQLREPHIAPLVDFVQRLRKDVPNGIIPDFDPWDGGIEAELLYLLEAPGPKAGLSGFISRNNPDETAKNFFELNVEAGIPRKFTVCWNAVPWYIGSGKKIRAATPTDVRDGLRPLLELLSLLPRLRAVVFLGRKAEFTAAHLRRKRPDLKYFRCPHPSPMYCNRAPENRQNILNVLRAVSESVQFRSALQQAVSPTCSVSQTSMKVKNVKS
jgi:Uracil DNA glycosylase superfamily